VIHCERFVAHPYLTWNPRGEVRDMLAAAGFDGGHAHSDFTFKQARDTDTSFIVLGERPGS
jgi:hypothetical protein